MGVALDNFHFAEARLEIGDALMDRHADAATVDANLLAAGEGAPKRKRAAAVNANFENVSGPGCDQNTRDSAQFLDALPDTEALAQLDDVVQVEAGVCHRSRVRIPLLAPLLADQALRDLRALAEDSVLPVDSSEGGWQLPFSFPRMISRYWISPKTTLIGLLSR